MFAISIYFGTFWTNDFLLLFVGLMGDAKMKEVPRLPFSEVLESYLGERDM